MGLYNFTFYFAEVGCSAEVGEKSVQKKCWRNYLVYSKMKESLKISSKKVAKKFGGNKKSA